MLHITDIETIHAAHERVLTAYWLGDEKKRRQFGVTFVGDYTNSDRDGVVESIILALALGNDMMDTLEGL